MRSLLTLLLVALSCTAFCQKKNVEGLLHAVNVLDDALIKKDSAILGTVLNARLSYGHSNGWIQSKKDVIDDLFNGKLTYGQINHKDEQINIEDNSASLRMTADLDVVFNDKPMQLKLSVLQMWVWKGKHWELMARQSVKIN